MSEHEENCVVCGDECPGSADVSVCNEFLSNRTIGDCLLNFSVCDADVVNDPRSRICATCYRLLVNCDRVALTLNDLLGLLMSRKRNVVGGTRAARPASGLQAEPTGNGQGNEVPDFPFPGIRVESCVGAEDHPAVDDEGEEAAEEVNVKPPTLGGSFVGNPEDDDDGAAIDRPADVHDQVEEVVRHDSGVRLPRFPCRHAGCDSVCFSANGRTQHEDRVHGRNFDDGRAAQGFEMWCRKCAVLVPFNLRSAHVCLPRSEPANDDTPAASASLSSQLPRPRVADIIAGPSRGFRNFSGSFATVKLNSGTPPQSSAPRPRAPSRFQCEDCLRVFSSNIAVSVHKTRMHGRPSRPANQGGLRTMPPAPKPLPTAGPRMVAGSSASTMPNPGTGSVYRQRRPRWTGNFPCRCCGMGFSSSHSRARHERKQREKQQRLLAAPNNTPLVP